MCNTVCHGPHKKPEHIPAPKAISPLSKKTLVTDVKHMTTKAPGGVQVFMFHQSTSVVVWDHGNSFLMTIKGDRAGGSMSFPITRGDFVRVASDYDEFSGGTSASIQ